MWDQLEVREAMGEIVDKRREESRANEIVPVETGPIEIEEPVQFSPEEVARMLEVKAQIASGHYTDVTDEHRKLLFVQWLIEHDRLKS